MLPSVDALVLTDDILPSPDDITAAVLPDPADDGLAEEPSSPAILTVAWVMERLRQLPVAKQQPGLLAEVEPILERWHKQFQGPSWQRFLRKGRLIKEFNEIAPVIARIREAIPHLCANARAANPELVEPRVTVVDLCSGYGFLSMFLAELVPANQLQRLVLVDRSWPEATAASAAPHQISWDHIKGGDWKVPMGTRKTNIKASREVKQLQKYVFGPAEAHGPVVILAVHLCGGLSCKAVKMFNDTPSVKFMLLKPCCLPSKQMLRNKRNPVEWTFPTHSFTAFDVHAKISAEEAASLGSAPTEPGTGRLNRKFSRWVRHLHRAVDTTSHGVSSSREKILVQPNYFQNEFIFAERE